MLGGVKKALSPPGGTSGKSVTSAGLHASGGGAVSTQHATPLRSDISSSTGSSVAGVSGAWKWRRRRRCERVNVGVAPLPIAESGKGANWIVSAGGKSAAALAGDVGSFVSICMQHKGD